MIGKTHLSNSINLLNFFQGYTPPKSYINNFIEKIDTVPGNRIAGGWGHRYNWGHDSSSLKELLKDTSIDLKPHEKKIIWAEHIISDSKTSAGVPIDGLKSAKRILTSLYLRKTLFINLLGTLTITASDYFYRKLFLKQENKYAIKYAALRGTSFSFSSFGLTYMFSKTSWALNIAFANIFFKLNIPVSYFISTVITKSIEEKSINKALKSRDLYINTFIIAVSMFEPTIGISLGIVCLTWSILKMFNLKSFFNVFRLILKKFERIKERLKNSFEKIQKTYRKIIKAKVFNTLNSKNNLDSIPLT